MYQLPFTSHFRSDHCLEHYLEISNVLSQKRNKVPREKREGCMAVYCSKEEQQKKYTNAAIDISRPTQQLSLSIDSLWSPSLDKLKKEWRNQANSIEVHDVCIIEEFNVRMALWQGIPVML